MRHAPHLILLLLAGALGGARGATESMFDEGWKFYRGDSPQVSSETCGAGEFPIDLGQTQCMGLKLVQAASTADACQQACCAADPYCETWQFCPAGSACARPGVGADSCWVGSRSNCHNTTDGWVSRARAARPVEPSRCAWDFCKLEYDDASWRGVETPHDWSAEDLPPRAQDESTPVVEVRNGTWLFARGDNASWSDPALPDADWARVQVPHDWRDPAATNFSSDHTYGWYRRHFKGGATAAQLNASVVYLSLGTVASGDETYLNGVRIGGVGAMKGDADCHDYLFFRFYEIPKGLLKPDGDNVIAVRVYSGGDGSKPGGLFDSGEPDERVGMFDPGAAPGEHSTGYTVGGTGWYRKAFTMPSLDMAFSGGGGTARIVFDGVYMNSDVWLNGKHLGTHPYGYTTFSFDITPYLLMGDGAKNILAVRVRTAGRNSRWYPGSGIFRHVRVLTAPRLAVAYQGLSVVPTQAKIDLSAKTAEIDVTVAVRNADPKAELTARVEVALQEDPNVAHRYSSRLALVQAAGRAMAPSQTTTVRVPAGSSANVSFSFKATGVKFWSPDAPFLYRADATVTVDEGDDEDADTVSARFGVRTVKFSPDGGFELNGKQLALYGGCVHHDNGPLGTRTIARAEWRRVALLKENGYNAIRTSHNPVSPAFVEACDRLGMLLMEEAFDCWDEGKNPDDYNLWFTDWWRRDMSSMVLRDRNSPSIVMWSIGNEIPGRFTQHGYQLSAELSAFVRELDPPAGWGRGITSAYPGVSDAADQYFAPLDVAGYNYSPQRYQQDHDRVPSRVMVATESFPIQSFDYWAGVWNNSWVIGDFIWTAIDYIGESAIGSNGVYPPDIQSCGGSCEIPWSYHISFCGDLDIVGLKKPQAYYRNVLWGVSKLELAVHAPIPHGQQEVVATWGWPDERQSWTWGGTSSNALLEARGQPLNVNVYSRFPSVELLLNGKSVGGGRKSVSYATQYTAAFEGVPYEAGTLVAVGFDENGKAVANRTLRSAGPPAALRASADTKQVNAGDRDDLVYVVVEVTDSAGIMNPLGSFDVAFSLQGDGAEIAAVGSGDPTDTGSFFAKQRRTYRGRCVAILRPTTRRTVAGKEASVVLTATAPNLKSASVKIDLV